MDLWRLSVLVVVFTVWTRLTVRTPFPLRSVLSDDVVLTLVVSSEVDRGAPLAGRGATVDSGVG